jgi:DNA-binding NtrC family response regulator
MVITAHDGVAGPFRAEAASEGERLLSVPATPGMLRDEMERTERAVIEASLREHGGDVSATAAGLGVSRRALYDRMKKYGVNPQDFRG